MSILIDTCIWSAAFRKRPVPESRLVISELHKLLYHGQALLPGAVRLEILSGLHQQQEFERIRLELRKVEDFPIQTEDYESAASIFTTCRSKGIQGSNTDFLLCALALHHDIPIFTTDNDFQHYKTLFPIKLYPIPHP